MAQLEKGRFVAVLLEVAKRWKTKTPNPDIDDEKKPGKKKTPLRAQGCGEESLTSSSHRSRRKMNPLLRLEFILYPGLGEKKKRNLVLPKNPLPISAARKGVKWGFVIRRGTGN